MTCTHRQPLPPDTPEHAAALFFFFHCIHHQVAGECGLGDIKQSEYMGNELPRFQGYVSRGNHPPAVCVLEQFIEALENAGTHAIDTLSSWWEGGVTTMAAVHYVYDCYL